MSIVPQPIGAGELAFRVTANPGPGVWFSLLVPEAEIAYAAKCLADEIESAGDTAVSQLESSSSDARDLADRVKRAGTAILVVSGLERLSDAEWRHLDLLRSRFQRDQAVVLVLGKRAFEALMRGAPNLASWLGGSTWQWDANATALSDEEKEKRLQAIREWTSMSDAEVLVLAEHHRLPAEPEYAEWLVLLGRGELLERR